MSKDAERLLADNELGVNKDSVEFLQLCRELLKALVKLTKLLKQREMGNHEAEKAPQITPPFLLGLHQLRKSKKNIALWRAK